MKHFVGYCLRLALAPFVVGAFLFILFNCMALLFGVENSSRVCQGVSNHNQSNFDYYFFPLAKYECQENGGLIQPAASSAIHWLGEKH